jgi:hypothetical protein
MAKTLNKNNGLWPLATPKGFGLWGWSNHPHGPRGWFGHLKGPKLIIIIIIYFIFFSHGVAKPPQIKPLSLPKWGWPREPPLFFFSFFIFFKFLNFFF